MKTTLLTLALLPFAALSQTKTTVDNGDFLNPLVWDCMCLPANGDTLIINHYLNLNSDIAYDSGSITISSSGTLSEASIDRAFWIDGTGSLSNAGTFSSHLLLVSPNATYTNTGIMNGMDSVMIQGTFTNTGTIDAYDVLNDQGANFSQLNEMIISHDFNNQGNFYIGTGATLEVGTNFSNCNIQSDYGYMDNDGIMCIANDFSNCPGDTIAGDGDYFIGAASSNLGVLTGNITVHTPSGSLDIAGTIDPSVTVTTGSCTLDVTEEPSLYLAVYPNPVVNNLHLNISSGDYAIVDLSGRAIQTGTFNNSQIDLSGIQTGSYLLQVNGLSTIHFLKTDK